METSFYPMPRPRGQPGVGERPKKKESTLDPSDKKGVLPVLQFLAAEVEDNPNCL